MKMPYVAAFVAAFTFPAAGHAASITAFDFSGYQAYNGGNMGFPVGLPLADRSQAIGNDAGYVNSSYNNNFTGEIGSGRIGAGEQQALTQGLFADDGFFLNSEVSSEVQCVRNPTHGTCPPFLSSQATLQFSFTVDVDAALYLDGAWAGGDGTTGVNLVDFFGFSLVRLTSNPFNPDELLEINTNATGFTAEVGIIDATIGLLAGETYVLSYNLQTHEISPGAVGVPITDVGQFILAASVIETNASTTAFQARFAAASPVPLPAAGWMLLAGIGALGAMRKRRL